MSATTLTKAPRIATEDLIGTIPSTIEVNRADVMSQAKFDNKWILADQSKIISTEAKLKLIAKQVNIDWRPVVNGEGYNKIATQEMTRYLFEQA